MDTAYCEHEGVIFNIQPFSVHDGPGIRTTVFLKGCPLRCFWCCNPESQHPEPEIFRKAAKCLGVDNCGICLKVCPNGAFTTDGIRLLLDRQKCLRCRACAEACPSNAIAVLGKRMTVKEVLEEVNKDAVFYAHSGGGISLSGGEALFQPVFAESLCKYAQKLGLETALETCAYAPYTCLSKVARFLDCLLVDLKIMDSKAHQRATGVPNTVILRNIQDIRREFPSLSMTVRMPVIPSFNDTCDAVRAVACFVKELKGAALELLPYHPLGEGKYENLGLPYTFLGRRSPEREQMEELRREAARHTAVI